jgi:hypothetical protein
MRKAMKKNSRFSSALFVLAITVVGAQAQQPAGVFVHIVVTVEANKGKEIPVINREDVIVHEGRDRDTVVDCVYGILLRPQSIDAVGFVRPNHTIRRQVPLPVAYMCNPLGFFKLGFAVLQVARHQQHFSQT